MWAALIPSVISGIGSVFSSFFGLQQSKIESLNKTIEVINSSNLSASEREKAVASVIASETSSGYWLSAVWRPILMLILAFVVLLYCFGFTTPNLLTSMPESSMIAQLFEILKIGIMGYMPLRTVDKIVESLTRTNTLKILLDNFNKK